MARKSTRRAKSTKERSAEASSVYDRGQTVIPKKIREAAGIEYGTRLHWELREGVIQVMPIPKEPIAALYGILKGKGPTFQEYLAERNAERRRELELGADEERRWRSYSTRQR